MAQTTEAPGGYAVQLTATDARTLSRWWGIPWLGNAVRFILLIPHFLIMIVLAIGMVVIFLLGWIPILVTGRVPLFQARWIEEILRRGSRLAGRMNTRWYALYVRRKRDRPEHLSAREHRELTENIQLAISLGATIVYRESEDVARALIDFAREEKVRVLVLGRPTRTGIAGRFAPGIVSRVLESASGLDVFVVDIEREQPA